MRDETEIRKWMLDEKLKVNQIAEAVGCNHTVVSNTLASRRSDRKVLNYLLKKGCPEQYLGLPDDMKKAA